MPPPPSLIHNQLIVFALIGFALITAGLLLRRGTGEWRFRAAVPGLVFSLLFLLAFALILRHADRTAFGPGGSVPSLGPVLQAGWEAGFSIQRLLVENHHTLTAYGAVLLLILALLALFRRRPAFFWLALALVSAVRAEALISGRENAAARWFYYLAVLAAVLGTAWRRRGERVVRPLMRVNPILFLAILAVLNLALGFHGLDRNPRFDEFEATNALAAVQYLEGSQPTREMIWSYFPRSYGADTSTSALFTIPAAYLMRAAGVTLVVFRAYSVFWAVLSVLLLYLLGRSLIGEGAGLIAAVLFTFSPWHLTIYRAGMFGSQSVAYTLLFFLLLLKAIRSGDLIFYLLAGFLLSFYHFLYLPTRFLFPLAVAVLAHRSVFYRGFLRRGWKGMLAFLGIFLFFFFLQSEDIQMVADPAYVSAHEGSIYPFIGSESRADMSMRWELVPGQLLQNLDVLYRNLSFSRQSGSFTYPPERGLLNRAAFLLAILGLGWSLANWRRTRGVILLLWLVPALAPFMVLVTPIGSVPRHVILGIPLAALLAGAFLQEAGRALAEIFPVRLRPAVSAAGVLAAAAVLVPVSLFGIERFFNREEPDQTAIARLVDSLLRDGYRLTIHYHSSLTALGPRRVADFFSFDATGRLHRHRTNIRRYYDYIEVAPDPWRQYRAGSAGMEEFVEKYRRAGKAVGVIGDPSNRAAVRELAERYGAEDRVRGLTGLDGRSAGYYFLIEGEPLVIGD